MCIIGGCARHYVREIANLKQELALKDALHGRPGISYDDLTWVQLAFKTFLKDNLCLFLFFVLQFLMVLLERLKVYMMWLNLQGGSEEWA